LYPLAEREIAVVFGGGNEGIAQARQENIWMECLDEMEFQEKVTSGKMGPHPWDDHEGHTDEHLAYMRRPDFLEQPDLIKARFQVHLQETALIIAGMAEGLPQSPLGMGPGGPMNGSQGSQGSQGSPGGPMNGKPPGLPGPRDQPANVGRQSLPGQGENTPLPSPPDLSRTMFNGINI